MYSYKLVNRALVAALTLSILAVFIGIGAHLSPGPKVAHAAPTNSAAAGNPGRLQATPHAVDQARSADDLGVVALCRYDTSPVSVGDGDANDLRCGQTGELHTLSAGPVPAGLGTVEQSIVACTDAGNVAFTSNALDKVVWVKNTDTVNDVVITFGTAGTPDRTSPNTWMLRLGADAGSGTNEVVALPAGFGASFECDTAGAPSNLIVTAFR